MPIPGRYDLFAPPGGVSRDRFASLYGQVRGYMDEPQFPLPGRPTVSPSLRTTATGMLGNQQAAAPPGAPWGTPWRAPGTSAAPITQPSMGTTYPWIGPPQPAMQHYAMPSPLTGVQGAYLPTIMQAPEDPYLPTIMRGAPAWANANPWLGDLYTPQAGGASVGAQAQVGGALVDRSGVQGLPQTGQTLTGEGATTPGGRVEPKFATAPPGVDVGWYKQFQVEHDGEKPEDFYARTGEGLDEAIADREWGDRFAQMMGRAPSEWDWENHWYDTRAYGRPQGDPGAGWRRKSKRGKTDVDEKRAPLYVPERTSWRL